MKQHLLKYINDGRSDSIRGLRILLEYFYASESFAKIINPKRPVISVFGSARTQPGTPAYREAHKLGELLYNAGYAVVTGASQGIMQAANEGIAHGIVRELTKHYPKKSSAEIRNLQTYNKKLQQCSLGLQISLPFEENLNEYVGTAATFHYFMVRKFFFAALSRGFIACEGGWGTRDELFEIMTLIQTGKAPLMPIIYMSKDPTHLKQDLQHAIKNGHISQGDLKLLHFCKTPQQAVKHINQFYHRLERIEIGRQDELCLELKQRPVTTARHTIEAYLKRKQSIYPGHYWKGKTLILPEFKSRSYGDLVELIAVMNR